MCLALQLIPIEMEVEAGLGHCCHNIIDIVTRDATSHVTQCGLGNLETLTPQEAKTRNFRSDFRFYVRL